MNKQILSKTNQKGFAPILIIVLLLAGIGIGAYYVQQNTSFLPRAENNAPRTDGGSCRDNPMDPPSTPSSENFNYKWQAFCSNSCSQNSDCPENKDDPDRVNPTSSNWCYGFGDGTNKCLKLVAVNKSDNQSAQTTTGRNPATNSSSNGSGSSTSGTCGDNPAGDAKTKVDALNRNQTQNQNFEYYWKTNCSASCSNNSDCAPNNDDPDRVNPATSNWCYGFGGNINRCMKLIAVNKGTTTPATTTTGRNPTQTSFGGTAVTGTSGGGAAAATCTTTQYEDIANTYYDAKVAQRYARYTAIINGAKEYCVQADLGIEPGQRRNSADGTNGRLYLCSRANNSAANPKLVWRVISDDGKQIMPLTTADPDISVAEAEKVMIFHIGAAKQKLDIQ